MNNEILGILCTWVLCFMFIELFKIMTKSVKTSFLFFKGWMVCIYAKPWKKALENRLKCMFIAQFLRLAHHKTDHFNSLGGREVEKNAKNSPVFYTMH